MECVVAVKNKTYSYLQNTFTWSVKTWKSFICTLSIKKRLRDLTNHRFLTSLELGLSFRLHIFKCIIFSYFLYYFVFIFILTNKNSFLTTLCIPI